MLDVHPVERGDVFGYRSRTAPKHGHILVVSGGTAHGIGLEAPTGGATLKDRAARVAKGGLDAAGFVRSPYTVGGKQRLFAEPPHMQASMLFLPNGAPVPAVGDEVDVRVRYTATTFDRDRHLLTPAAGRRVGSSAVGSVGSSVRPSARTGSFHGARMSRTTTTAIVELGRDPDPDRQPVERGPACPRRRGLR